MSDGLSYYLFVPMLATLYGRDRFPHRYLRVVDEADIYGSTRHINAFAEDPGDPEGSCIVETVDTSTFMEFISFGYTPYIECAFSGFKTGLDLSSVSEYIFTEAALRNYEARAKTLIDLAERKRYSIAGKSTASQVTSELVDETLGVFAMWEQLMNRGRVVPLNCLESMPGKKHFATVPIKTFKERFNELEDRMLISNYTQMKYKLSSRERDLFKSYFA